MSEDLNYVLPHAMGTVVVPGQSLCTFNHRSASVASLSL